MPAAWLPDRFGRPTNSWRMAILPYLQSGDIFNSLNYSFTWDSAENQTTRNTKMATFLRPEAAGNDEPITKFFAVVGPPTPFPDAVNLKFDDIRDGLSTTIMFGEVAESDTLWAEPRDLRLGTMDFRVNGPVKARSFGSPYGGARALLMDGSVISLLDSTHPSVVRALVTANCGEVLEGEAPHWKLGTPPR